MIIFFAYGAFCIKIGSTFRAVCVFIGIFIPLSVVKGGGGVLRIPPPTNSLPGFGKMDSDTEGYYCVPLFCIYLFFIHLLFVFFFIILTWFLSLPGMRILIWLMKLNPGLCSSNEWRFLKVYNTNISDNFKTLVFCFHTSGVRHIIDVLDSENQPGSG